MRLKCKQNPDPKLIAELHYEIGSAIVRLRKIFAETDGEKPPPASVLRTVSQDRILKASFELEEALMSLETPFFNASGDILAAPFAKWSDPELWKAYMVKKRMKEV